MVFDDSLLVVLTCIFVQCCWSFLCWPNKRCMPRARIFLYIYILQGTASQQLASHAVTAPLKCSTLPNAPDGSPAEHRSPQSQQRQVAEWALDDELQTVSAPTAPPDCCSRTGSIAGPAFRSPTVTAVNPREEMHALSGHHQR